ncbi:DUF6382 domain-containing protein [Paenibacillus sp. 481]|uniref:DUF6382 domain-containing protein n=1 Tax=Paenibacillus sp. 481 TaxID=2835869 RepID=UPI001E3CD244|nr:DUF6382 domain-containing protein [Paenibacillus sp. 481]UHA72069.1 FHA domain-containing protein [Paenibacillus sp. 481]
MYGFRADFLYEGKAIMALTRDGSFHADDLDNHQVNMLKHNRIPHLLPMDIRIVDYDVRLLYDISGKKMLHHMLKGATLTSVQFYEWMLQLVRILEDCQAYFLHPNHMLLHEQYVFVSQESPGAELYVTYVPTTEGLHPRAGMEGLRRMGTLMSLSVSRWEGNGFQRLNQLLCDEISSLSDVRCLLQTLIVEPVSSSVPVGEASYSSYSSHSNHSSYSSNSPENKGHHVIGMNVVPVRDEFKHGYAKKADSHFNELAFGSKFEKTEKFGSYYEVPVQEPVQESTQESVRAPAPVAPVASKRLSESESKSESKHSLSQSPAICAAVLVLICAIGWKFGYLDRPSSTSLMFSSIWSILAVFAGWGWMTNGWEKWRGNATNSTDINVAERQAHYARTRASSSDKSSDKPLVKESEFQGAFSDIEREQRDGELYRPWQSEATHLVDSNRYYESLQRQTTVLGNHSTDSTTVLDEATFPMHTQSLSGQQPIVRQPYLIRDSDQSLPSEANSREIPIRLDCSPFVIGRAEQGVNYRDERSGVSKMHCEFELTSEGGCFVRDLGSKNGMDIQGEQLIPYKSYELKHGDSFKIAGNSYHYREH